MAVGQPLVLPRKVNPLLGSRTVVEERCLLPTKLRLTPITVFVVGHDPALVEASPTLAVINS